MKFFFSAAVPAIEGEQPFAAVSVRQMVKEIIDEEPPDAVLSDDKIVPILRGMNVDIARRTVAKYREMLGIPSSVQRRRQKGRKRGK